MNTTNLSNDNNNSYQEAISFQTTSIDYHYIIAIAYVFVQTTICSIGFLLNLINFSVFIRKRFTASAYVLMTVLSLADAITLGVRIPQGCIFLPHLSHHATDAAIYIYMYSIYVETPVTNMSENISAWLTVALAIERNIIAFIFNIPYFAIQRVSLKYVNGVLQLHSDLTDFSLSIYYAFYSWLRIVFVQIIPLCFLCLSNCLLFILVSQHNRRFTNQTNCNSHSSQYKSSRKNFNNDINVNEGKIQTEVIQHDYCTDSSKYYCKQEIDKKCNVQSLNVSLVIGGTINMPNDTEMISSRNTNNNMINTTIKSDLRSKRRQNAQSKLTILLIGVILLFLIGQVPQALAYVRVFTVLGVCSIDEIQTCIAYQMYRMITINLAQFAFASTFVLYIFLNKDFRETLKYTHCQICLKYYKQTDNEQHTLRETNYISE
ncbi:unnamed protein product [Heterobilharzia americana]|nr:unnamed protein product [Heterobilharzia americana]